MRLTIAPITRLGLRCSQRRNGAIVQPEFEQKRVMLTLTKCFYRSVKSIVQVWFGRKSKGTATGMLGWNVINTRRTAADQTPEPSGVQSGLLSGTRVATSLGWRAVQALCAGDLVVTFDAGLQPLTGVTRHPVWTGTDACPQRFWPLDLSRGVLGNRAPLRIMPHQVVMVESDLAETLWGDPFALVPGAALDAMPGVNRAPPGQNAEAVQLHFETEQVVFAEHGLMALCPSSRDLLEYALSPGGVTYEVLPMAEARGLMLAMARLAEPVHPASGPPDRGHMAV